MREPRLGEVCPRSESEINRTADFEPSGLTPQPLRTHTVTVCQLAFLHVFLGSREMTQVVPNSQILHSAFMFLSYATCTIIHFTLFFFEASLNQVIWGWGELSLLLNYIQNIHEIIDVATLFPKTS